MASEAVQCWLDETLATAADLWAYIQEKKLDDSFGWGAMFGLLSKRKSSVCAGGILLTGPDGCGKHTASEHMVKHLFDGGYDCVFLDGLDLGAYTIDQVKDRLEALFDHFYDQGKGLCLSIENMEDCPIRRPLLSFLGQTLNKYWLLRDEITPLFLILIDHLEKDIPAVLRNRIQLCRMSLPDHQRRRIFFEANAKGIKNYVSVDAFVKATEGFTYAQLLDLVHNVEDLVDVRDGILSEDDFLWFASEQMPMLESEGILRKLTQSAQQLVDTLPKMLSDALAATRIAAPATVPPTPVPTTPPPPSPWDQADYVNKKQDEIENMRVFELAEDLFGQNGVNELIQKRENHQ